MTARERVAQLLKAWPKIYPHAHCELDFRNPLELLVATILSAQSTDKRVNMVTPALFRKYRTAKDYADAPLPELENAIKSTGFYRNKAKSIRGAMREIVENTAEKCPIQWRNYSPCRVSVERLRTWCWATLFTKTKELSSTHT